MVGSDGLSFLSEVSDLEGDAVSLFLYEGGAVEGGDGIED